MNIIFEILYLLSVFYLLALYFSLFRNVVSHRRETKTSLGHKGEKLERVIRAHSNFCETIPFNLFLSLILIPVLPIGVLLGKWLNLKLSDNLFYNISHVALFLCGVHLIIKNTI